MASVRADPACCPPVRIATDPRCHPHLRTVDLYFQGLATDAESELLLQLRDELAPELSTAAATTTTTTSEAPPPPPGPLVAPPFPEIVGDIALLRFLRGNDHSVLVSAAKFRAMLAWRASVGADAARNALVAALPQADDGGEDDDAALAALWDVRRLPHADKVLRHYPERLFHGADARGNPLMVTQDCFIRRIGSLMREVTAEEYLAFRVARGENRALLLQRLSERHGRMVKLVFIWDLAGMSLGYFKKLTAPPCAKYRGGYDEQSRDCYPEICFKIVAVHVPWFLQLLWGAAAKFMNKQTLSKISVSGASLDALHEIVGDAAQLPASLGGTSPAAAAAAAMLPAWEAVMPLVEGEELDADAQYEALEVGGRGSAAVTAELAAGATAIWEFRAKEFDIGASVSFRPSATAAAAAAAGEAAGDVEAKCMERHHADALTRGSFVAPEAGVVTVTFDNSYSMFRSKTVLYTLTVMAAAGDDEQSCAVLADADEGGGAGAAGAAS